MKCKPTSGMDAVSVSTKFSQRAWPKRRSLSTSHMFVAVRTECAAQFYARLFYLCSTVMSYDVGIPRRSPGDGAAVCIGTSTGRKCMFGVSREASSCVSKLARQNISNANMLRAVFCRRTTPSSDLHTEELSPIQSVDL